MPVLTVSPVKMAGGMEATVEDVELTMKYNSCVLMMRGLSILENRPETCTLGAKSMSLDTKQERSHPLWQNTKPQHSRGRRHLTKPMSLPAPGARGSAHQEEFGTSP